MSNKKFFSRRQFLQASLAAIGGYTLAASLHTQAQTAPAPANIYLPLVVRQDSSGTRGWHLNETNTGLAGVGIDKNSLPLCEIQPNQYGFLDPPSGTIVRERRIDYPIYPDSGNITLDRCWIRPTHLSPGMRLPR